MSSGSTGRRRSSSIRERNGRSTTGPVPGVTSMPNPTAWAGTTMSLKSTAASTPYRRTGCSVISAAMSGRLMASRIDPSPRADAVLGKAAAGLAHEPDRSVTAITSAARRPPATNGGVTLELAVMQRWTLSGPLEYNDPLAGTVPVETPFATTIETAAHRHPTSSPDIQTE